MKLSKEGRLRAAIKKSADEVHGVAALVGLIPIMPLQNLQLTLDDVRERLLAIEKRMTAVTKVKR